MVVVGLGLVLHVCFCAFSHKLPLLTQSLAGCLDANYPTELQPAITQASIYNN